MCGGGDDRPDQTPEERMLGEIAVEKWNDYESRFKPIEDEFIADSRMTNSDYSQARGQSNSAVQQSFNNAEASLDMSAATSGVNPSSSSYINAVDDLSIDKAVSTGAAINEADDAVSDADIAGLKNVVAMGQGQSIEATGGLSDIAIDATEKAINRANNSYSSRKAGAELAGMVLGAGVNAMNNNKTT